METSVLSLFFHKVQKQPPELLCKEGVLINFTKFTGKHLCQCLVLNKVARHRPATLLKKETLAKMFSCEFCVKFLRTLFYIEHLWWLLLKVEDQIIFFTKHLLVNVSILKCSYTQMCNTNSTFSIAYFDISKQIFLES